MVKSAIEGKKGCGPLAIIVIVLVIIAAILGINEGIEAWSLKCEEGEPIWECLLRREEEEFLTEDQKNSLVTASGPYTYQGYSVTVTAEIPLSGGPVSGLISGTCTGNLNGTFDGKDNGGITGTINGVCNPFFFNVPASATFNGTVNKDSKAVPISFTGKGAGFSHDGSMVLAYQ